MPPGEARRMGAPAAASPLAVPQPEFPAAGSPPRTVQMPDPAVPREAPPVVPTDPEPVVQGGGLPPTHGMQGAAPMGRTTAGEREGDAAQEAAVAGPRDISELLAQALEEYRRTAVGSGGAAPAGAHAGELIAQARGCRPEDRRGQGDAGGGGFFGGTGRGAGCAEGAHAGGGRRGCGAQWGTCQGGRSGGLDVGVAGVAPGGTR